MQQKDFSMVSKYTFLLSLIFIVYSNNAMENDKRTWSFSQALTNFLQRCEAERALWRQGYIAHSQPIYRKSSIAHQINSVSSSSVQKSFSEKDM